MQVVVDGILTNYLSTGKGPVMLCIHGWGSNVEAFRNLPKYFKKYRIIALDLPGFGATEPPQSAWGLADYARFIRHFTQKLDLRSIDVIVSHSNGAAIAVKALSTNELSTEKFIVLGGAGVRYVQKGRRRYLKAISAVGKPLLIALPTSAREKVTAKWYDAIGSEMMLVPGMEETFKKVVSEDVVSQARLIDAPTLLVYGENDQSTPPQFGRIFFENFPNAQLEIVGGAGHYVHIDREHYVMDLMKEFLS